MQWYLGGGRGFKVVIVVLVPVVEVVLASVVELIVVSVVKVVFVSLVKVAIVVAVARKLVLASCGYGSEGLLSSQGPRFPTEFVIWVDFIS